MPRSFARFLCLVAFAFAGCHGPAGGRKEPRPKPSLPTPTALLPALAVQADASEPPLPADLVEPAFAARSALTRREACEFKKGDLADKTVAFEGPLWQRIPIDHFVIVMQENRSFDHYFQQLPKFGQPAAEVAPEDFHSRDPETERDVKMMILSVHLLPTVALVDYELTLSMPASLTAAVGVDTLTHGIEAYVSRKAHGMTDPLALSCIQLVAKHLRTAYREPNNHAARAGMMLAACQGGMAFANSSVCLVHGMSRPIGALFHVPHGLSNAVLLPTVTQFSWPASVERYATVARLLGCCPFHLPDSQAAESLVAGLQQLNADLSVPRLRECCGVEESRFRTLLPKMAADALASGSPQNNPRVPTAEEIVSLYEAAW